VIGWNRQKTRCKFHFLTENGGLDAFLQGIGAIRDLSECSGRIIPEWRRAGSTRCLGRVWRGVGSLLSGQLGVERTSSGAGRQARAVGAGVCRLSPDPRVPGLADLLRTRV
jgi:hypothetical protein